MQVEQSKSFYAVRFDSLLEVTDYNDRTPRTWSGTSATKLARQDWDLNAGYEGAQAMARDGWRDGASKLAAQLDTLPALDTIPDWTHDVAGFFPDVPRYLSDMPDCMWTQTTDSDSNSRPIITLAINIGANHRQTAEAMSNFGLAVARYVDQLQTSGARVEVIACTASDVSGVRTSQQWTVKGAGDHLNLETLAFSIGHPAAYRRLWFAFLERLPKEIRECDGYGFPKDVKLSDIVNPTNGTIVLNGMTNANTVAATPEAALDYVGKQIEAARLTPDADAVR